MINKRGFSYIEVLIASALLSILMLPIASGFYQAMANLKYSVEQYQATLLAKSLLLATENILTTEMTLSNIFSSDDFDGDSSALFNYRASVYAPKDGEFHLTESFTSNESQALPLIKQQVEFTGGLGWSSTNSPTRAIIYYDGSFHNIKEALGEFFGNSCQINYLDNMDKTIDLIFSNVDSSIELVINNLGESNLYLYIYTPFAQALNISFGDENKNSFVYYLEYIHPYESIVTAEIFDNNNKILSRTMKPIYGKAGAVSE